MAAARRRWAAEMLHFWFHELTPAQWFGRSDAVDAELRRRFLPELAALRTQPAARFLTDRETARAAILLFDQAPRNLFRNSACAFAFDPLAREICKGALARGWDRGLALHEAQFLLLPLMHSESRADQHRSLRAFTALGDAGITGFARAHARMVMRFGRFPHRNEVLDRRSTPAERRAVAAGNHW
ncbi:MAG: DUF924 family protein [Novosphingobium sp.]